VKETIPRWCEDKRTVAWDVLELAPDTTLGHMLDETSFDESPPQVLSWLEDRDPACASETQWGGAIAAADYRAANPTDFRHLRTFACCTILADGYAKPCPSRQGHLCVGN